MKEIKCPHCGKEFKLDDAGYADILAQVKNEEFDKQLHERLAAADKLKEAEVKAVEAEVKRKAEADAAKKAAEAATEIQKLKAELEKAATEKELAVSKATAELEKKKSAAESALEIAKRESQLELQSEMKLAEDSKKALQEQIAFYKDMKAKQSNKILGESLEQHCEIEFNKIRAAAFPNAKFGKDNVVEGGTKGDYIFKDVTDDKIESVSIMFEMKNEFDESVNKKKNEDFLDKLHKDRVKKNCEYAVLVTQLEPDNELYNSGIVDVSHIYPKMYIIRPQFFIPMITLLRNAALKNLDTKRELELAKAQSIDVTNFESNLEAFQKEFATKYGLASKQWGEAIDSIDDAIADLQKVKEWLEKSGRNLRLANDKAQDVSVKKLTKGAPSVAALLEDQKKKPKKLDE